MKRAVILLLAVSLLLTACGSHGERIKEPVTFYYLRSQYPYGTAQSVIGSEEREASGHRGELRYLMALYLMGPSGEDLRSPIPPGTNIFSAEQTENSVTLKLSDTAGSMTDVDFSLACACLSLTCMDLTGADKVTIACGNRSITMTPDTLILYDIEGGNTAATEETQ